MSLNHQESVKRDCLATIEAEIRRYYYLLNERNYTAAFEMHNSCKGSLQTYINGLEDCMNLWQNITIQCIDVSVIHIVHIDGPTRVYGDKDFICGKTHWLDGLGNKHTFLERWVKSDNGWKTRCSGYVCQPLVG